MKCGLKEKIYSVSVDDSQERLSTVCEDFFREIVARRKENIKGLGAAFIITDGKFAGKICEDGGEEEHMNCQYNLYHFNDRNFIFSEDSSQISYQEWLPIRENCFMGRIVSRCDELLMIIHNSYLDLNSFQREIVQKMLDLCKKAKDMNVYPSVEFGFCEKSFREEVGELTENKRNCIEENIGKVEKIIR